MSRVVFLLEEYSMKLLLDGLLPRLYPELEFLCIPHEGKNDLERSIPRKLRAWREPGVSFVVVRDNDRADCRKLKTALAESCARAGRPDTLIRIACQELEAWYLGDPNALATVFDDETLKSLGAKERFRDPDSVMEPAVALLAVAPTFQKLACARAMSALLDPARNTSRSFQVLVSGIETVMKRRDI